jgi:HEAT repeat protein
MFVAALRSFRWIGLIGPLALAGCAWWPAGQGLPSLLALPDGASHEEPGSASARPGKAAKTPSPATPAAPLADGVWVHAIAPPSLDQSPGLSWHRWRHPELESLAGTPEEQHATLRKAMEDKNPVVAGNAAIGLARLGDGSGQSQLVRTIRSANLKLEMRCAAAEALGEIRQPSPRRLIGELIDQYGKAAPEGGSQTIPELHAELIRSLARHVDPADDRRLTDALKSPSPTVRLEAINAWAAGRQGALPVEATDLRSDPDLRVRTAALRACALRHDPHAHEYLAAAVNDAQLQVRLAAVAGLGLLGDGESKASLLEVKKDEGELIRAAAVMSLARLGETRAVLDAVSDRSWRVRLAVAQSLTACANPGGRAAARKLLGDVSSEVQRATVSAIAAWPLPQAGPLLLEALASSSYNTRRTAARELVRLWPAAAGFPIDGPAQRRAESIEQLQRRFREEFGSEGLAGAVDPGNPAWPPGLTAVAAPPGLTAAAAPPAPSSGVSPGGHAGLVTHDDPQPTAGATRGEQGAERMAARVDQCLGRLDDAATSPADRQAAIESLVAVGLALVPILEQRTASRQIPLPEAVYHEVLPGQNPVYAALDRLASGSLPERRRAAEDLAESARHKPLGRLATERLAAVAVKQGDSLVWQGVLTAVENDAGPAAVQLAYAAIGHGAPEVRRRACQYLAAHPDPRHVAVLLPALGDSSDQVVAAALRAIGAAGKLDDPQPVRRLLTANDAAQRLEAAGALARLGDPAGLAALERLAYSDNPSTRQRTAELMGELGSEACVPSLVRLLDDNWQSVRLAALKSLPKAAGQDVARTEGEWSVTAAQRITLWKQWFQQRTK